MANERTVDVNIRARDEASQVFKELTKTFGDAAKSQQQFTEELEQTDKRFKQLSDSAKTIAGSLAALKQTASTAAQFGKLNTQLGELNAKLAENKTSLAQSAQTQQQAAAAAAKAIGEYAKLRAELSALRTEQSEVAARQKQLGATLKTAAKFDELTAQVEKYEAAISGVAAKNGELASKQAALTQQVNAFNRAMAGTTGNAEVTGLLQKQRGAIEKELSAVNKELEKGGKSQTGLEARLTAVIAQMDKLGDAAIRSGVDLRELTKPVETLQTELAQLGQRAGEFDARFAPVNGALNNAKAAATSTAAELKQAEAALASSQRQYTQTGAKVAELAAKLDPLQAQLTEAGVDTAKLATEQDRLQSEVSQTSKELRNAEGSLSKYARSASQAAGANENFLEKGRKALSFTQRLRGQVLSLVSAYIGLYGAINQVSRAFEVGSQLQGTRNTLLAANSNDQQAAAAEFEYTSQLADRLGQDLLALSQQYAKLRVASKESGISLNSTRLIFESLTEAATVMRLRTEDTAGVFNAITQIFSKGKIQAEELRQQLGDRLPGAVSLLAKGLNVAEEALNKMLQAGELSSESLIALAIQARNQFGDALKEALTSPQAEFNRLNNEVTKLRDLFFQTAEQNGLAEAIAAIREEIAKPEFQEGVQSLAKGFVELIAALPDFYRQMQSILPIVKDFALIWVGGKLVAGIRAAAVTLGGEFVVAGNAAAATALRVASAVNVMFAAFTVGLATFSATTWLRDQFDGFRKATDILGASIVYFFAGLSKLIINFATLLGATVADAIMSPIDALDSDRDIFEDTKAAYAKLVEDLQIDFDGLSTAIEFAGVRDGSGKKPQAQSGASDLQSLLEDEAKLQQQLDAQLELAEGQRLAKEKAAEEARLKEAEKAAKKRIQIAEQVADGIRNAENALTQDLAQLSGDPAAVLDARLKDIENGYAELYEKIAALGGEAGAKARAALDGIIARQKEIATASTPTRGGLVQDLEDELAVATGNEGQVALDKLVAEYEQQVAILKAAGRQDGIEIANSLFNIDQARLNLTEVEKEFEQTTDALRDRQLALAAQVEIGDKTEIEAKRELNRERLAAIPIYEKTIAAAQKLADTTGNPADIAKVQQLRTELIQLKADAIDPLVQSAEVAFADGLVRGIEDWISGVQDAQTAFREFAAEFLRTIARMILQEQALAAAKAITRAIGVGVAHSGAIVGRPTGRTRRVNPDIFSGAARYHSGGMVGLRPDEVPAILQRGEEVLSRRDPRNAMNGGGAGGSSPISVKVVNAIDAGDFVSQGLQTAQGQEAVLNFMRANKGAV